MSQFTITDELSGITITLLDEHRSHQGKKPITFATYKVTGAPGTFDVQKVIGGVEGVHTCAYVGWDLTYVVDHNHRCENSVAMDDREAVAQRVIDAIKAAQASQ